MSNPNSFQPWKPTATGHGLDLSSNGSYLFHLQQNSVPQPPQPNQNSFCQNVVNASDNGVKAPQGATTSFAKIHNLEKLTGIEGIMNSTADLTSSERNTKLLQFAEKNIRCKSHRQKLFCICLTLNSLLP